MQIAKNIREKSLNYAENKWRKEQEVNYKLNLMIFKGNFCSVEKKG